VGAMRIKNRVGSPRVIVGLRIEALSEAAT
jgi:hypothetical protein